MVARNVWCAARRQGAVVVLWSMLLASCGGRSWWLPPEARPGAADSRSPAAQDQGSVDQDGSNVDAGPRRADLSPASDTGLPADTVSHDSCLPIPASKVKGTYSGTWSGTLTCPGSTTMNVNGTLTFTLAPDGSATTFRVNGSMSGVAVSVVPFTASISGRMGCVALLASLPDIEVGKGTPYHYRGSGSMRGTFATLAMGAVGFKNGTWTGKQVYGSCNGTGTWKATQQ